MTEDKKPDTDDVSNPESPNPPSHLIGRPTEDADAKKAPRSTCFVTMDDEERRRFEKLIS